MLFGDRYAQHLTVGLKLTNLCLHDATPLDRHQGLHGAAVGRGNEDLGDLPDLVFLPVCDQFDAVAALPSPAHILTAPHPKISAALDLIVLGVVAAGMHAVATRLGRCESRHRPPFPVGGHRRGQHRCVLGDPLPVKATVVGLLAHAVPAMLQ